MSIILDVIMVMLNIFWFAILIRAILSWFPVGADNPIKIVVDRITEPMLNPIRGALPRIGSVDLSPMAAIMILIVAKQVINWLRSLS